MALSGTAVKHADDGYSRRGNLGGFLVCNMVLNHLPDGTNVYGSRGGDFRGIEWVIGVESCKIVFLGVTSYSLFGTLLM